MKRTLAILALFSLAAVLPAPAHAVDVVSTPTMSLHLDGYLQALGVVQSVPDKVRNSDRVYLFLKEARLRFTGNIETVKYEVMLAPGAEDITPNTNSALGLLDFNFDVPLAGGFDVKVGQFLVPYGRERLTTDSTMSFGDRSIENLGFAWNRDYGLALSNYSGKMVRHTRRDVRRPATSPSATCPRSWSPGGRPLRLQRRHRQGHLHGALAISAQARQVRLLLERALSQGQFDRALHGAECPRLGQEPAGSTRTTTRTSPAPPPGTRLAGRRRCRVPGSHELRSVHRRGAGGPSHFDNKYGNLCSRADACRRGSPVQVEANRVRDPLPDKKMAYVNAGSPTPS